MNKKYHLIFIIAIFPLFTGCGTIAGRLVWDDETVYPATQWDIDRLTTDDVYPDIDPKDFPVLLSIDIPFSLVTDTILLPYDGTCVLYQWLQTDEEQNNPEPKNSQDSLQSP